MVDKISFFLIFLLFTYISSDQHILSIEEKKPIKIKIGKFIEYDIDNNYFQLDYFGSTNNCSIYFIFLEFEVDIYLTNPNNITSYLNYDRYNYREYRASLDYNGTYFLKVICRDIDCDVGSKFISFVPGYIIDTIDLNKKAYINTISFDCYTNSDIASIYKVSKLNEEKYVYFSGFDYRYSSFFPYYSDEIQFDQEMWNWIYHFYEDVYYTNSTIFEVCIGENINCQKNVKLFKFEKNKEYTIKIHVYYYSYYHYYSDLKYFYPKYFFFQITEDSFKPIDINNYSGILYSDKPIFYIIDKYKEKTKYLIDYLSDYAWTESIYMDYYKINETMDYNNYLSIVDLLNKTNFIYHDDEKIKLDTDDKNSTLVLVLSLDFQSKIKIYCIDEIDEPEECKDEFNIPANQAKIFANFPLGKDNEYFMCTYHSEKNKIRLAFSEEEEGTNTIIQNIYPPFPIFAEANDSEYVVNIKNYLIKYALFAAIDPYYYKSFYRLGEKLLRDEYLELENYINLTQANYRINSYYLPIFEFYNLYLNGVDIKLNIYIRQLYGGTELYECEADDVNVDNLEKITKPISNAKCKNKKPLINRLFNFNGEKIISGYITYDSYFDIYAEIDNDNNIINISPIIINLLDNNNTAKYLKKDIEYYINFNETYKVKLEPGFNAQIILTNGLTTYILNDKNATTEITGNGFRIKSDKDAMVYFFAKIQVEYIKQIKIENREGKYVKISNISLSDYTEITIDFGFEGFLPSSFPVDASYTNGTIYLDNLYNKMKKKLVKDEYLYIYYYWNINQKFVIEYLDNNLNIKNNDFNILFIPKNEGLNDAKNVLLINTFGLFDTINYIHFCFPDTFISIDLENKYHQRFNNQNNNKYLKFELELFDGNNKLEFNTNQSFIFSYSFFDILDDGFFNDNQKWKNERKVLEDLTIIEAFAKNNDNKIISIRFKPNYRNSSTRYIIVIAKKNEKNTLNNFNNPCYIAELLNQRPKEIIVDTICDIGDNDLIYAEVDISSIIGFNKIQYFLVNIVSQELRYDKNINFYIPIEFNITMDTNNCSINIQNINDTLTNETIEKYISYITLENEVNHYINKKNNFTLTIFKDWHCTNELYKYGYFEINTSIINDEIKFFNDSDISLFIYVNFHFDSFFEIYNPKDEKPLVDLDLIFNDTENNLKIRNNFTEEIKMYFSDEIINKIIEYNISIFDKDNFIFNDFCYNFTIENIDMPIKERRQILFLGYISKEIICNDINCDIENAFLNNFTGECNCRAQNYFSDLFLEKESTNNITNKEYEKFINSKSKILSFINLKCGKESFNHKNIKNNVSFIVSIVFVLIYIILSILYYIYSRKYKLEKLEEIKLNPPKIINFNVLDDFDEEEKEEKEEEKEKEVKDVKKEEEKEEKEEIEENKEKEELEEKKEKETFDKEVKGEEEEKEEKEVKEEVEKMEENEENKEKEEKEEIEKKEEKEKKEENNLKIFNFDIKNEEKEENDLEIYHIDIANKENENKKEVTEKEILTVSSINNKVQKVNKVSRLRHSLKNRKIMPKNINITDSNDDNSKQYNNKKEIEQKVIKFDNIISKNNTESTSKENLEINNINYQTDSNMKKQEESDNNKNNITEPEFFVFERNNKFSYYYWKLLSIKQPIINLLSFIDCLKAEESYIPLLVKIIRIIFYLSLDIFFNSLHLEQKYFRKKFQYFNEKYNIIKSSPIPNISLNEIFLYSFSHTIISGIICFIICMIIQSILNYFFYNSKNKLLKLKVKENDNKQEIITSLYSYYRKYYIVIFGVKLVVILFISFCIINFNQIYTGGFPDLFAGTFWTFLFLQLFPFIYCIMFAFIIKIGIQKRNKFLIKIGNLIYF